MPKKLPNLYVNKIDKKMANNDSFYYTGNKEKNVVANNDTIDIKTKIEELFNSPNFVYKMNVLLTLKDNRTITKDIVGEVNGKLITMDEELIDINDIKDIKF